MTKTNDSLTLVVVMLVALGLIALAKGPSVSLANSAAPVDAPPASSPVRSEPPLPTPVQTAPMPLPVSSHTLLQGNGSTTNTLPNGGNTSVIYHAPTPELTAVANAIAVEAKSLQILVTVKPGLQLAHPVTISIGFDGPRQTQPYLTTGNRFVYRDPEGDGTPRRRSVSINLSQPKPGGGILTFDLNLFKDLDPLYTVLITPLEFQLITSCALVAGASDLTLHWIKPSKEYNEQMDLSTFPGFGPWEVGGFAWSHSGVSASKGYHQPQFWFYAYLPPPISQFQPEPTASHVNLLPGKTTTINTIINEGTGDSPRCNASLNTRCFTR